MILLVCGGRGFREIELFAQAIAGLPFTPTIIIQGGADGADRLAKQWASRNGIHCAEVRAMWENFGKAAGHKRNSAMLALKPDYCLAMPGGVGTRGMVGLCKRAGVVTWQPYG